MNMAYGYAYKAEKNEAKAVGVALPISFKHGVAICNYVRGRNVSKAKTMLDSVMKLKNAVPYTRYNNEMAHNKNVGSGRFPIKTCAYIKEIIESAEANAQLKGLSSANLIIKHIAAQNGGKVFHQGRNGRKGKRAHIEVVLVEGAMKKEATLDD